MMKISNYKFQITNLGFTLIELLVVISVIGILAALLLARFSSVDKSGRDTRRKSDINQYRIALENYATKTAGVYPNNASDGDSSAGTGLFNSTTSPVLQYLSAFPPDPLNDSSNGYNYYYRATSDGTTWVLQGRIEGDSSASWQICSSGKVGKINSYSINPDSSCDL